MPNTKAPAVNTTTEVESYPLSVGVKIVHDPLSAIIDRCQALCDKLGAKYPEVMLSFGYLGNISFSGKTDDRSWYFFTKVETRDNDRHRFGGFATENLENLANIADEKLEDWILFILRRPGTHYVSVGDTVRSYDFETEDIYPDNKNCYVEGVVTYIGELAEFPGCRRYRIQVTRQVLEGEDVTDYPSEVFPPINGTSTLRGKTSGVVVIKNKD